jgi:Spy/CpxP family protein refolding chaperone
MKIKTRSVTRVAAVALSGLMLAGAAMVAQQDGPPPPPGQDASQGPPPGSHGGPHGRGGMNPERRVEMMTHVLNLSPEQQTALRQVFADERAKIEADRSSGQTMSPQDRRAAMMSMHQDETTKINAILLPDQRTKYAEMEARMHEREQERREQGPPPPPSPQQ